MKKNRGRRVIIIGLIILMTTVTVLLYSMVKGVNLWVNQSEGIFSILAVITEFLGAVGLIIELGNSKKVEEADFIVELNEKYISCPEYQGLILILEQDSRKQEEEPVDSENEDCDNLLNTKAIGNELNSKASEEEQIWRNVAIKYLDFFEPIYILIEQEIIDISMINNLFGYRFFAVVNNKWIQEEVINNNEIKNNYLCYENIANLHFVWEEYRIRNGKEIPYDKSSMKYCWWYKELLTDTNRKKYEKMKKR